MEEVLYRVEDGAAWITMNRPTKGNSISGSMGDLIVKYLAEAEADPNVSAIVLAAAGTYWCTGADLGASNQSKVGEKLKAGTAGNDISQVFQQIKKSPKPVIARVQGPVMGGGLGFLFACDIRVSINSAFFAFSEAKRGIVPALISAVIVPQMGPFFSRDFMMTARRIPAQRYYELGLLSDVVSTAEELDQRVKFYLSEFESSAPDAMREIKRLVGYVATHSDQENLAETARVFQNTFQAEEARYGVAQFQQKQKPDWRKFHQERRAKL